MIISILALASKNWPRSRPRPHGSGLSLGLELTALALASRFWPRLTSLLETEERSRGYRP